MIKKIFFLLALLPFFLPFHFVSAEEKIPDIGCSRGFLVGCNEAGGEEDYSEHYLAKTLIPSILSWVMTLSASAGVLMGVVAGIMFLFAGGNEELRGRAIKTLLYAGLGLILAMFAYLIVEILSRLNFTTSV